MHHVSVKDPGQRVRRWPLTGGDYTHGIVAVEKLIERSPMLSHEPRQNRAQKIGKLWMIIFAIEFVKRALHRNL